MRTSVESTQRPLEKPSRGILELIGNTPLIPLANVQQEFPGVQLVAKLEWFNPGGSVKDRAAASIIADAEASGRLREGVRLLDASSGNTAIAYAMIAAAKGYQLTVCVPRNANPQVLGTIKHFGAELVLTDPLQGSDGAIREARRLSDEWPTRFLYLDQYNNPTNWQAHYRTTAAEIWEQTDGTATHFVAGLGTTGTFIGTTRRLKAFNPSLQAIAVQPDSAFHGLEGLKHLDSAILPGIYDPSVPDETLFISTETAYAAVERLVRQEGLLVGPSSGAVLAAALQVASRLRSTASRTPATIPPPGGRPEAGSFHDPGRCRQPPPGGGTIVMIFPDAGGRYAAEGLLVTPAQRL